MRTAIDLAFLHDHAERKIYSEIIVSSDGEKIFLQRNFPKSSRLLNQVNHIIMVHELSFYHERFAKLVDGLIRKMSGEVAFTLIDLRGHGLSTGHRGVVNSFDDYVEDLLLVINHGPDFGNSVVKTSLLGEGGAGLIVLKTILEERKRMNNLISGAILINPLIKPRSFIIKNNLRDFFKRNNWDQKLRMKNIFNSDVKSTNQNDYNKILLDPLNQNFMTSKMLSELLLCSEEVRFLSYYIDMPTLTILSEDDKITDSEAGHLFAKGIDSKFREIVCYHEEGHNLIWGKKRDSVVANICQWLRRENV